MGGYIYLEKTKYKNDSCEIEKFVEISSLQAAWDTYDARYHVLKALLFGKCRCLLFRAYSVHLAYIYLSFVVVRKDACRTICIASRAKHDVGFHSPPTFQLVDLPRI